MIIFMVDGSIELPNDAVSDTTMLIGELKLANKKI